MRPNFHKSITDMMDHPRDYGRHGCHCGPNSDHWSDSDHLSQMVRFLVQIWLLVRIFNRWYSCLALSENNIIRYMKRVKTEFLSSKLVRYSKQISNANISAPVRDNPSKFSLRGRPESQLFTFLSSKIPTWSVLVRIRSIGPIRTICPICFNFWLIDTHA